MRGDLETIKGISDIKTDIKTTIATFKLKNKDIDLKKTLDEFAKDNEHIRGWSFIEDEGSEKKEG